MKLWVMISVRRVNDKVGEREREREKEYLGVWGKEFLSATRKKKRDQNLIT